MGGIKEKVLAAHRAGLKTILLPRRNESALEEVPEEVRQACEFVFAESADDVLAVALGSPAPLDEYEHQREQPDTNQPVH